MSAYFGDKEKRRFGVAFLFMLADILRLPIR